MKINIDKIIARRFKHIPELQIASYVNRNGKFNSGDIVIGHTASFKYFYICELVESSLYDKYFVSVKELKNYRNREDCIRRIKEIKNGY